MYGLGSLGLGFWGSEFEGFMASSQFSRLRAPGGFGMSGRTPLEVLTCRQNVRPFSQVSKG